LNRSQLSLLQFTVVRKGPGQGKGKGKGKGKVFTSPKTDEHPSLLDALKDLIRTVEHGQGGSLLKRLGSRVYCSESETPERLQRSHGV